MLGGPCMNLLIYLVLTVDPADHVRHPASRPTTTTVGAVAKCVVAGQRPTPKQIKTAPPTQLARRHSAGLAAGDQIVGDQRHEDHALGPATSVIEPSAGKTLTSTVVRDGARSQLPSRRCATSSTSTTRAPRPRTSASSASRRRARLLQAAVDHRRARPDRQPDQPRRRRARPATRRRSHSLWQTVFEGKQRDPQGAVGVVGIGRIGGEIADSHVLDLQDKVYTLIGLLAERQPAAVLLQPAAAAAARRRPRRRRAGRGGQARPGSAARRLRSATATPSATKRPQIFVDTAQMLPVMYAVASVLILVTLLTLYADIVETHQPDTDNGSHWMRRPSLARNARRPRPSSPRGASRARSRSARSPSAATHRSRCSR